MCSFLKVIPDWTHLLISRCRIQWRRSISFPWHHRGLDLSLCTSTMPMCSSSKIVIALWGGGVEGLRWLIWMRVYANRWKHQNRDNLSMTSILSWKRLRHLWTHLFKREIPKYSCSKLPTRHFNSGQEIPQALFKKLADILALLLFSKAWKIILVLAGAQWHLFLCSIQTSQVH